MTRSSVRLGLGLLAAAACGEGRASGGFPAGTYLARIPASELLADEVIDSLRLTETEWTVTFSPKGQYTVSFQGGPVSEGDYRVAGDTLRLENEVGEYACQGHGGATYQWSARGDSLTIRRVQDSCDQRAAVFSRRPLVVQQGG